MCGPVCCGHVLRTSADMYVGMCIETCVWAFVLTCVTHQGPDGDKGVDTCVDMYVGMCAVDM